MIAELNTRVDVLMVGALMNDKAAGIYTIAALIFEAALQTVVVVRNNINPRIAILISNGRRDEILQFSRLLALAFTPLLAAGAVIAHLAFPFVAPMLFSAAEFSQAREPLFWLMIALPLAGAPLCYGLVLSIAGYPLWQSVLMIAVLIASLAMHAVLIPLFGLTGAAVAMGLSTILAGVLSIVLARSVAGLRLLF
jgi:O-antigen/teichoic acid export membrane protein